MKIVRVLRAGQWLSAPGELGGAAGDGLDPPAARHQAQRLHAGHQGRAPRRQDLQAQLLRRRHLVSLCKTILLQALSCNTLLEGYIFLKASTCGQSWL